jgi:methionyl-tRNA formyltransferase
MTEVEVYDLYRAVYSFKNLTTTFNSEVVKLIEVSRSSGLQETDRQSNAGHLKFCWKTKRLLVTCSDKNAIAISKLSIGKKTLSANDFNNGYLKNSKANKFC